MKMTQWLAAYVITALLIGLEIRAAEEMKWIDALTLEIEGKGWAGTAGPYDRLPDSAKATVPQTAWGLSKDSAGLCVRFVTDAPTVGVRWSLVRTDLAMPHMPATGVSGVDLYARSPKGGWEFVGNGRPHKVDGNEATFTLPRQDSGSHECLLYLPLYNAPKMVSLGVPQNARLETAAPRPTALRRPVLIYGTSIAQGGCASRPGMVWSAILGRMLDRPMINLGFSGSGTMEPPVAETLAELDPAVYVIDCLWNIGGQTQEEYTRRVGSLIRTLRQTHPHTPIIFVGQSHIRTEMHPTELTRKQETAVRLLQKQGVKNLILVPGDRLVGNDGEGTVDGVHLTDLGMDRQARCLLPVLKKALRK